MGGQEGISIGSADHLRYLSAKQVMHDTGTLLEAVQSGQQRLQQRTLYQVSKRAACSPQTELSVGMLHTLLRHAPGAHSTQAINSNPDKCAGVGRVQGRDQQPVKS